MDALNLPPGGGLVSLAKAKSLILEGRCLCIAATTELLVQLPKGIWIGGSIPYFMAQNGGQCNQDQLFITEIEHFLGVPRIAFYAPSELNRIAIDAPENGFSVVVIPAGSDSHQEYARNAPYYEDMYMKPIIGWVSGAHLDHLASQAASVANGLIGESSTRQAVVMHIELTPDYSAEINTVNVFQQGQGPSIRFQKSGFMADHCQIDGAPASLSHYLKAHNIDTQLPLVADYCGMAVNISIKDVSDQQVDFYAPVFEGVEYRFAQPIDDYQAQFQQALPETTGNVQFACNCILNYLHCQLEGKNIAVKGPMTFGEIAYQLLNQTMVYLSVERVPN